MPFPRRAITLVAAVSVTAGAASGVAAPAAGRPPCTPRVATVDGHKAAFSCGPATLTLHLGGRSYAFRDGFCQRNGTTLILSLGTLVLGMPGNDGKAFLNLTVVRPHVASISSAYYGGRKLMVGSTLVDVTGSLPAKGSFTSRFGARFTGSWNCNGVVYTSP